MLDKLLDTTTESEHQRWLLPMTPTSLTETTLTLGTKNEFSRDYIKDHYIPFLIDAAKAVTGKKIEIFIETLHDEPEALTVTDALTIAKSHLEAITVIIEECCRKTLCKLRLTYTCRA